ncbi:hypothetical protein Tco_0117327 [Tanacetum coccineum]
MDAKVEAVQIILTGIDNYIYSTVDACPNAMEMWKTIKRLKQGESIDVQDLKTNLYWEFGNFTSYDGETLDSYYSRFYKMMNELVRTQCIITNHQVNVQFLLQLKPEWQRFVTIVKQNNELKTVSYHKLYDILKQHQNEVNEIRAKRLARTANPLALVAATQQLVYNPQPKLTHYNQKVVSDEEATPRDKEIEKLMALILKSFKKIYKPTNNSLKTSSNIMNKNVDNTPRFDKRIGYDRQTGQYENQRAVNVVGARENGMQESKMKQVDWKDETDDEPDDQELEAHYMYMAKIQEVIPDAADNSGPIFDIEPLEKNITHDPSNMSDHGRKADHDNELAKERNLLASLIEQMKFEIDESKKQNKCLESSNKAFK